jgi:methionine-rich copper-binding protein CopC
VSCILYEQPWVPLPHRRNIGQRHAQALHAPPRVGCEGVSVPNQLKLLAFLAALTLPPLALPGSARAHAILEASVPPAGAAVKPGPLNLQLRYNSRIDQGRSRLTLIRPDQSRSTVAIAPDAPPDIINAHLDLPPGAYVIRWQVLAVDGHITRGDVPITVTAP